MNRNHFNIALFFFVFFTNYSVSTQDLDFPSNNPEVVTYFFNEAFSLLNYMEMKKDDPYLIYGVDDYNFIPFYVSVYGRASWESTLGSQYNASLGTVIRLNDYFSIPLFFNSVGGRFFVKIQDESAPSWDPYPYDFNTWLYNNLYTGGGLIFSNNYGTIGAFAGYYNFVSDADFFSETQKRNFRFGVIPLLNTKDYPVLKYAVKFIQNHLSFDFHESKIDIEGFTTKIISNPFVIKEDYFAINSVYYYYKDEYISAAARTQTHGGGISINIVDRLTITFETGIWKILEVVPDFYKYEREMFATDTNYWFYSAFLDWRVHEDAPLSYGFQVDVGKSYLKGAAFTLKFIFHSADISGHFEWPSGSIDSSFRWRHAKR
jgi:hypothetical protein